MKNMNNMDLNGENVSNEIPQRAVSLYGQNEGIDDFPVLKAFQQYIDAEQEKARKRIIGLGIFFGVVLIAVIAVFMILLHGINTRNQSLSDRLVEYAMKEADRRQQLPTRPDAMATQNNAMLKAMTDTLAALQKNIEATGHNAVKQKTDASIQDIAAREDAIRLQRARTKLESEKKLLEEERERLRQMEIEQQRRKLYPEFYGNHEQRESPSSRRRSLTDEDIRDIIREAYQDSDIRPSKTTGKTSQKKTDAATDDSGSDDDAIEYFKDDDYSIPVDVKGSSSKVRFIVPVD